MKLLSLLTILQVMILSTSSLPVYAQSNSLKAQSAYMNAEDFYKDGKYQQALDLLDNAQTLLDKPSIKIQYLSTKIKIKIGKPADAQKAIVDFLKLDASKEGNIRNEMIQQLTDIESSGQLSVNELAKLYAQEKYDIAYNSALKMYEDGNFQKAIAYLQSSINYGGKTTSLIQYLLTKSYMAINDWKSAQKELEKFFEITKESEDERYREMVKNIAYLEDKVNLSNQVTTNNGSVNVTMYEMADVKSKVVTQIPPLSRLNLIENSNRGFVKVKYKDKVGYISDNWIKK